MGRPIKRRKHFGKAHRSSSSRCSSSSSRRPSSSSSSTSSLTTSWILDLLSDELLHFDSTPSSRESSTPSRERKGIPALFFLLTDPTNQHQKCRRQRARKPLPTQWRPSARRCSR